jgi:hypothetical protein
VVASPSPAAPVAVVATPILIQSTSVPLGAASTVPQSGGSLSNSTALIIAVLGVCLVAAGYLLRRRSQPG